MEDYRFEWKASKLKRNKSFELEKNLPQLFENLRLCLCKKKKIRRIFKYQAKGQVATYWKDSQIIQFRWTEQRKKLKNIIIES